MLDESGLLSCMAYVDLNPVRADIAQNLEQSDFTSIQQRIFALGNKKKVNKRKKASTKKLMSFMRKNINTQMCPQIPFTLRDYIELVDWIGRAVRSDKRGHILKQEPKLLSKLGVNKDQWEYLALSVQKRTSSALHGMESLTRL